MDLTPAFNEALQKHGAGPLKPYVFRLQDLEEFLKEAYRIQRHIAELYSYLRSIRPAYLSAAHPPRRKHSAHLGSPTLGSSSSHDKSRNYLTDTQRTQIDADTKALLRDLNNAISNLTEAEKVRQAAESTIALRKRAKQGLGALGRWAAGGAITAKSPEEQLEEARQNTVNMHRESIVWYLQRRLEEVGRAQSEMMEIRLNRELEKSKSILYKARGSMVPPNSSTDMNGSAARGSASGAAKSGRYGSKGVEMDDTERQQVEQHLSPEQLQLFAQENQDMLKHYEDTLDQVRTAERSLLEISELQTTLVNNLELQSAHIDQLVQDSHLTTENVGKGNKELTKASERKSTARMVFYSTCIFCSTLILWDLFI